MRPTDLIKLKIGQTPEGSPKWVCARRATADHYGWTEEFPIWTPRQHIRGDGEAVCFVGGRHSKRNKPGGRGHRISESPSRDGFPRGLTHRFKLSINSGLLDIAELAHFTQQDWHWMTTPSGERWGRCQWESAYRANH